MTYNIHNVLTLICKYNNEIKYIYSINYYHVYGNTQRKLIDNIEYNTVILYPNEKPAFAQSLNHRTINRNMPSQLIHQIDTIWIEKAV